MSGQVVERRGDNFQPRSGEGKFQSKDTVGRQVVRRDGGNEVRDVELRRRSKPEVLGGKSS